MAYHRCGRFEWDPSKAEANREKHGIGFDEASALFSGGAEFLDVYDDVHSDWEGRFIAIGPVARGLICVVYTRPDEDRIRIISARVATRREFRLFERYMRGMLS